MINLSAKAFWDTDITKLDYEKQSASIIQRVFEYGTWDDILQLVPFYGKEKVIDALLQAPYLKEATIYLCSFLFHLTPQQFQCYGTKQYHPL